MPVPTARNAGIAMLLHGRSSRKWRETWDSVVGPVARRSAVTPRRPFPLAIMLLSCHPSPMANLQVKNIPDDLHDRLRAYARESNSTISRDSPDQTTFPGYSSRGDTAKYNPAFQERQMRPDSLKVPAFIGQPLYCQA